MEKYSRYIDDSGRLFVILARYSRAEISEDKKDIKLIPTTIELLNVHEETMRELTVEDFERYVQKGLLKRYEKK